MQTALEKRLTDEKLCALGRLLVSRYCSLRAAMEKDYLKNRRKYRKYAEGDFSDRDTSDERDIFSKSNIPLEFITGVADFMAARTSEDIFGSDPYFSTIPQGPADATLAQQIQRHFGYKLREAQFISVGRQAIKRGYDLGEGLFKGTWRRVEDRSEEILMVMCQPGVEQPVTDENGEFITADDFNLRLGDAGLSLWARSEILQMPRGAQWGIAPTESGAPPLEVLLDDSGAPVRTADGEFWFKDSDTWEVADADGLVLLCKNPIVSQEEGWGFEERAVEDVQVLHEGLDVALLEHEDLVLSLTARTLEEAVNEGVFHRLSLTAADLREKYGVPQELIDSLQGETEEPKAEAVKPQAGEGEKGYDPELDDPQYECLETYIRHDVLGDGVRRRVFALVEKKTEKVLAIDYLARVTPGAILPIFGVVPCPRPGRWHGRGYHEIYAAETEFIDRTFNSIIHRNKKHANPPMFIREDAFTDAAAAKNFKVSIDGIHKIKRDFDPNQVVGVFGQFPDLDSRSVWMLELVIQMAQIRSGVTGAAQGALAGLPANGTATGVQSIMLSGSTLHKLPIENVKDGLEGGLNILIQILYSRQNREETFAYMEGDASQLLTLNPRTVRGIRLNVRLLLTRLHEREALESAKAAIAAVGEYLALPEAEKDQVRPLFIQVLKALRITGADAILRKALPPDPDAKPPQSERFTESLNYKDAPPDIRRQMEAAAGYTPSTMADVPPNPAGEGEPPPGEVPAAPLPENAA